MTNRLLSIRILVTVFSIIVGLHLHAQEYANGMRVGKLRIKLIESVITSSKGLAVTKSSGVLTTGIQSIDGVNARVNATVLKRVFPYSSRFEERHRKHGLHLWYEITFDETLNPTEVVREYQEVAEVALAEPVYEKQLIIGSTNQSVTANVSENPFFDDPFLPNQWHYNNDGQTLEGSVAGADINLRKAWEIETGSRNVIVNVVDGGFETDHEDLAPNTWVNELELNGEPGVDDDDNGYVDDIHGYNFATNDGHITSHYHGTHVAGTVAAANNNGLGVSGIAGGSGNDDGVRIMSSQVFTEEGAVGSLAAGIIYGADNGAVISQNSWGFVQSGYSEQVVLDAIDYFIEEAGNYEGSPMRGGIVFFAAGNDNDDAPYYPAYYDKAIAVSAFGPDLTKASYSNYGPWVDIAAPGGETTNSLNRGVLSTSSDNSYAYLDGTSMACPHVSGIAALIVSKFGGTDFTNEKLRTHIFTSLHNIDQYNPDYKGQLGKGYIDAYLALQKDNGIAPANITSLTLAGISQDFANLSWTIPADEDDGNPVSMEVYYSTVALTSENINQAEIYLIEGDLIAGEVFEYEISGLESTTTYYFAVRTLDRWGNTSGLSNIVSGTTNDGPDINADASSFALSVDNNTNYQAGTAFNILNEAEGTLKWTGGYRHANTQFSTFSVGLLNYPTAAQSHLIPDLGKIHLLNTKRLASTFSNESNTVSPLASSFYEEIYHDNGVRLTIIGENDTTITNSSATRFDISNPEGFNLTAVSMLLKHKPATGPMILEVYKGMQLDKKHLIYAQEVTSTSSSNYWHKVVLNEQLYFNEGESFWIVFHVPSGNLYPLGIAYEREPSGSDKCMMSFDIGETWVSLEEALGGNPNWAWTTTAISNNKYLGDYIVLSPDSGVIAGYNQQNVELSIDASTLINGDYNANVVIESNDKDEKYYRIPLSLTVSGHSPVLKSTDVVNFGSVFYGHQKTETISISNSGFGNFVVQSVVSTDPQFKIVSSLSSVDARDQAEITVLYTPDGEGNDNATIEMEDIYGNTHQILLFGVGAGPANIEVDPTETQLPEHIIGQTSTTSFNISNTGKYPLEFVISQFAENIELESMADFHKFGYSVETNANGQTTADYVWDDISQTGINITEALTPILSDYHEVELGFDFPFYDKKVQKINILKIGALSLDQEGPINSCSPPFLNDLCAPKGYISALTERFDLLKGGNIYYYRSLGKFIVQYQDMIQLSEEDLNKKISFQIVLHYNGDIEFVYKDVTNLNEWKLNNCLIAIGDTEYNDVLIINGAKHWNGEERITGKLNANEVIFRLKAPGEQMISNVSESHGLIKVGETKTIDVDITTENLYNGDHSQRLTIFSNDPFRNPVTYTVSTSVTGGVPDLVIETDTIDFGQVFQGGNRSGIAIMRNLGTDKVDVTNLSLATSNFTFNGEQPYTIVPKSSYLVDIQLNTANKGVFEDALAISCSDNEVYKVVLKGEVIPAPDININVLGLSDTLEAGDKMVKEITITNNGEAKLELVAGGNDWLYIDEGAQPANTILKDFTYYVMDSNDEGGPEYNWENILEDGTRIAPEWYGDRGKLYQKIALPFEFSFYNEPCDTMWLSYEGFLTLKEPETEPWYIYPTFIPDTEDPNGIIAPYWTPHNPDLYNINYDTKVGVFYKFFEDRIVITWSNYIDFYGMGWPYSVQAILYKNGNIKYQYQRGLMSVTSLGVIGVENMDGTDGVQVSAFQDYVENRFAISLTPSEKINIAVGESRTLPIALDASYLNKGVFNGNLHLQNNVPKKEDIMVPVALTVNGEPELEVVDTIRFGDAMVYDIYTDFGLEKKTYYKEFELKNTGRANIDFTRVLLNNRIETNLEWQTIDENNFLIWENVPRRLDPLIPGESIKLRVSLQPSGTIIPLTDSVRIISNLSTEDIYIPVTANVIFPPVNNTPEDTIRVVANDRSHVETRTFVLDNTLGQSPLKYDLSLSFLRDGNPVSNAVVDSKAKAIPELLKTKSFDGSEDVARVMSANEEPFNQTLEYSNEELPYTNIGYGEDRPFIAATTFEAPESGFNLTHISTWYSPDVLLNSRLTVEIRGGGTSISDARTLSTHDYQINLDQVYENGGWLTLELPENQIFYPGELFYVVFRYQLGIPNPQGLVEGQINVEGRYMYEVDGAWYDLQYSYPGWGWMMKAHEKESKGGAWATINENVSGAVPAGETKTINVEFDASLTLEEDNKGLIKVSTNDPVKTESIIGLLLSLNRGPQYDLGASLPLKIDENDTLSHKIHTKDMEGDQYTISLAEAYEQVSIKYANDTITFVYTPDFESSGLQTFKIVGEDAFGNLSELDIEVMVNNVNRVPEIITPIMDRVYRMPDDENENFNLLDVFNEPDGQNLSFTVVDHVEGILTVYKAEGMMSLSPITIGTTQLDVIATDPEGASTTMSFIVDVFMRTAIDENNWTADVSMYPNPVKSILNITILNDESTAGEIRLLNTLGTVVEIIPLTGHHRHDCKVDLSSLANGLYYVQIQLGDKTTVRKVIKI